MGQAMPSSSGRQPWALLLIILIVLVPALHAMNESRRLELRNITKEMFLHGWNNYMEHAYPLDELNPILCKGRGRDKENIHDVNMNDVLGDYSLTMVDALDTLALMGMQDEFERAVHHVLADVSFDQDSKVQVFEINIRALGGLLSAHILASDPSYGYAIPGYAGGLLSLAEDLAKRLMPAFQSTKTGLPFPRVNLRYGVPKSESRETCSAGAGSLVLEFGVLSKLTGNPHYMAVAKQASKAIWDRRSSLGLVGNVINIETGQWIHTASSTGAGVDSFFEYLLKAYVLFGDDEYLAVYEEAYEAIRQHVRDYSGYLYRNVNMYSAALMSPWIDSLSAFMPGLQVLHGDLDAAIKGHLVFYHIWRRFHALPERFNFYTKSVDIGFYPLRPEFVESTYYLYRATKDPFYLHVGEMIANDLNNRTRLPCGFATMGDIQNGRHEDRMESFMLSETLKYLYLLFDTDNAINSKDTNFVFTTEGHVLFLPRELHADTSTDIESAKQPRKARIKPTCPAYNPLGTHRHYLSVPHELDMSSIPYRPQADFAAELVGSAARLPAPALSSNGYCEAPAAHPPLFDLTFGADENTMPGGRSPRLIDFVGGILSRSLSGLKIELSKRSESLGGGYLITRG